MPTQCRLISITQARQWRWAVSHKIALDFFDDESFAFDADANLIVECERELVVFHYAGRHIDYARVALVCLLRSDYVIYWALDPRPRCPNC